MSLMRQSVAIPLPWLVSAFVGTLGGVIVGGLWLGKRVSEEWYLHGVEAGRAAAKSEKKDKKEKKKEDGEESSSSEEEESDSEEDEDEAAPQDLNPFTDRNEECKLVLVVRTDLKMGSGMVLAGSTLEAVCADASSRQNRCAVRPCHPRLLQGFPPPGPRLAAPSPLGKVRTDEGGPEVHQRGGYAAAPGAGAEHGSLRAGHPRCWPHADCCRQRHSAGNWTWPRQRY